MPLLPAGVRAVIFDAVGTLIHPGPPAPAVYAAVAAQFNSRLTTAIIRERFRAAFAEEEALDQRSGWRTSAEREFRRWQHIVARVLDDVTDAEACFEELFDHFRWPQSWCCEPETGAILEELAARGYVLGMASNYDSRLRTVVAGLPALASLRHLVISSEVGWRKPAPEFFAALCREVGLPPEQVLFVGDDRANDFDGARAAGLPALLFDPQDRLDAPPEMRLLHLEQLLGQGAVGGEPVERPA